ncbi:hypothetical protein [Rhodoligotrophos defluvii]|uniref:hypothetical protein n=1 Tax=Rhodoligotrophos defluvii TaxID=2561934 RepID=UPI0010C9FBBA|nr:hypothetical protein [Rhodoligotrophos defluvii]
MVNIVFGEDLESYGEGRTLGQQFYDAAEAFKDSFETSHRLEGILSPDSQNDKDGPHKDFEFNPFSRHPADAAPHQEHMSNAALQHDPVPDPLDHGNLGHHAEMPWIDN